MLLKAKISFKSECGHGISGLSFFLLLLSLIFNFDRYDFAVVSMNTCNDSVYSSINKHGQIRRSLLRDGDFIIQGMMRLTEGCNSNSKIDLTNLLTMIAIQFAIDKAQKSSALLHGIRLGYQFDDTCTNLPATMARGIEIVSLHRPFSYCKADFLECKSSNGKSTVTPVTAVVGTAYSFTSIPLASLLGLYHIPQVSYSASSRLLSKKNLYKSFFRTIPSDDNQVLAMLDILQKFNWNYVFAVGSDDNYGKLAISKLKELAPGKAICIAQDEYIPFELEGAKAKAKEIVQKLKQYSKAKVVILFNYFPGQGEYILDEARNMGITRLWLTSDAWNPATMNITNRNISIDDLVGIFTVSAWKGVIPGFYDYVKEKIQTDSSCNVWLQKYLQDTFGCKSIRADKFSCGSTTLDYITSTMLAEQHGSFANAVNAIYAIAYSMRTLLKNMCNYTMSTYNVTMCPPSVPFKPQALTDLLYSVNFTGILNTSVQFDKNGDPKFSYYSIDNIHKISTNELKFVKIGSWTTLDKQQLRINKSMIAWPKSFGNAPPTSKCSKDCSPGEFIHAKTECCWSCQKCSAGEVSNMTNANRCISCPAEHHTNVQRTICIKTPVIYLSVNTGAGISILSVSCLGLIITFAMFGTFSKFSTSPVVEGSAFSMIIVSLLLLLVTFAYGILHLLEPSNTVCSVKSGYFFTLFTIYAALLLAKTRLVTKFLESYLIRYVPMLNIGLLQCLFVCFVTLVQVLATIVWLTLDPVAVIKSNPSDKVEILLECNTVFTTGRMIVMLFPCILLITVTVISFRERNDEHPFNEPKFLSFTTIATCIIVIAFLPTYKYVVGIYRAIVMAFTTDVCAFTFIGCMLVPKLYTAVLLKFQGKESENDDFKVGDCNTHQLSDIRYNGNGAVETAGDQMNHNV